MHFFVIMIKYKIGRKPMKKVLLLIILIFLLTSCRNIKNSSYEEIISFGLSNQKVNYTNHTSQGYSYYLPKGLIILEDRSNNLKLKSEKYTLYLYVDLISYYNKKEENYRYSDSSYYSQKIQNGDKFGYLEINLRENKKYLIEIMYNYAKIEVIVDNKDIKEMLSYAMALLNSISYNDAVIANMIEEDILNYNENEYNIFETASNESNFIQYDDNETNESNQNNIPDVDLIN